MLTPVESLVNTLIVGACEAAEIGQYEVGLEIDRGEMPELNDWHVGQAVQVAMQDSRIEGISVGTTEHSFRFLIQLLADAAETHRRAVEEGACPAGLKLERPAIVNLPPYLLN